MRVVFLLLIRRVPIWATCQEDSFQTKESDLVVYW